MQSTPPFIVPSGRCLFLFFRFRLFVCSACRAIIILSLFGHSGRSSFYRGLQNAIFLKIDLRPAEKGTKSAKELFSSKSIMKAQYGIRYNNPWRASVRDKDPFCLFFPVLKSIFARLNAQKSQRNGCSKNNWSLERTFNETIFSRNSKWSSAGFRDQF